MRYLFLFAVVLLSFSTTLKANNLYPDNCEPMNGETILTGVIPISFDVCFQFDFQVNPGEWYMEIIVKDEGENYVYHETIPGFSGNGPNNCVPVDGGSFTEDTPGTYTLIIEVIYQFEVDQSDDICTTTFEVVEPGGITGKKFSDINGNGMQDEGEPGLEGWIINLDNGQSTMTDADGNYSFTVAPGNYTVSEVLQENWTQTLPESGLYFVSVPPGLIIGDINFGNEPEFGIISGLKFRDDNGNGKRDDGEPGIEGWTFNLSNGTQATTTQLGYYEFINLPPGTYTVSEEQRNNWMQTFPVNPNSYTVELTAGEIIDTLNFGNKPDSSKIKGKKFRDDNGNGVQDDGEPGLEGWTIKAVSSYPFGGIDDEVWSATTDEDGNYMITLLPPGSGLSTVSEVQKPGWTQTFPDLNLHLVSVEAGETIENINFGNMPGSGGIGGKKFNDLNENGVHDEGEPGLEGWVIKLDNGQTAITDAEGNYSFAVTPGDYTVSEVQQDNWTQTLPESGSYFVSIPPNTIIDGNDFGNKQDDGRITGIKFRDDNGNGVRDQGEEGLEGWTIMVNTGQSATTGLAGFYEIQVPPGEYTVTEEQKAHWTQTLPQSGSYPVTVSSNETISDINFANKPDSARVYGKVFLDLNGNGIMDENELGLSDLDIYRHFGDPSGITTIASTDANGDYSATLSPLVIHTIGIEAISGYYSTTSNPEYVLLQPGEERELNFGFRPYEKPLPVMPVSPQDGETGIQASPPPQISWEEKRLLSQIITNTIIDTLTPPVTSTTITLGPVTGADGKTFMKTFEGDTSSYTPPENLEYLTEYQWTLSQTNEGGTTESGPFTFTTGDNTTELRSEIIPTEFKLYQNYPNPFNPNTTINYDIPHSNGNTLVTLKIYSLLGQHIATLVRETKSPGMYRVEFNASGLPSGTYFYTLQAGEFRETKKLLLLK